MVVLLSNMWIVITYEYISKECVKCTFTVTVAVLRPSITRNTITAIYRPVKIYLLFWAQVGTFRQFTWLWYTCIVVNVTFRTCDIVNQNLYSHSWLSNPSRIIISSPYYVATEWTGEHGVRHWPQAKLALQLRMCRNMASGRGQRSRLPNSRSSTHGEESTLSLFPFPTALKDPTGRKERIVAVRRQNYYTN